MTTAAFFQKSSSVRWASGSASIPRRTCSSVNASNRSQLVLPFEMVEERFLLMVFRLPGRDDAACLFIDVCIDYGDRTTLDQPNRIPTLPRSRNGHRAVQGSARRIS